MQNYKQQKKSRTKVISDISRQTPSSFTSRLQSFRKVHMINEEPISYHVSAPESLIPMELKTYNISRGSDSKLITRSTTLYSQTINQSNNQINIHQPQWLAQLGFYFTPLSIKHPYSITCSFCNQLIRDPIPIDIDISNYHLKEYPQCALSAIWKYRNTIEKNKDINSEIWKRDILFGDVKSEIAISTRRQTFRTWKHNHPEISDMVSSGLYYDPFDDYTEYKEVCGDDRVICMYCGLRLEQWEEEDDPIKEHRVQNPDCWVFNFDKSPRINQSSDKKLNIDSEVYIPPFELDINENNNDDEVNFENDVDVGIIRSDNDDPDTVVSLTTATTTTTTTALPVEIVEQDEVEEFLFNTQPQLDDNKMVEIPSMKSSDLSQFFTELDAESDGEVGASFFANNRRRRENRKLVNGKAVANVEPIAEEVVILDGEEQKNENESEVAIAREDSPVQIPEQLLESNIVEHVNQDDEGEQVYDVMFENDDFAFENFSKDVNMDMNSNDAKNNNFSGNSTPPVTIVADHNIDKTPERIVSEGKLVETVGDKLPETDFAKIEVNATENQDNHDEGEEILDKEQNEKTEGSRVQQLEDELKYLKLQIEALQNLPPNVNNIEKNAKILVEKMTSDDTKPDPLETLHKDLPISPDVSTKSDALGSSEAVLEIEENEKINMEKKENIDKNQEKEDTSVEKLEKKEKKEKKKKGEKREKKEKRGKKEKKHKNLKSLKRSLDNPDEHVEEAINNELADPLDLAFDLKKKIRKSKANDKKRQKTERNKVVKEEKNTTDDVIKVKDEEDIRNTPEVPTQIDDQLTYQRPVSDDEVILDNFKATKKFLSNGRFFTDNIESGQNADSKHDISPTLMRKKARSGSPMMPMDTETRYKDLDVLLDENPEENDHSPSKLISESDIMLKNQSTPYTNNTRVYHTIGLISQAKDNKLDDNTKPTFNLGLSKSKETSKNRNEVDNFPMKTKFDTDTSKIWTGINSGKYKDFYKDIHEATGYVKEVLDSKYELLSEDLDGLLTEFIAEIPQEQLKMTVREWIRCQEDQAVGLVLDKAEEMMQQFRNDQEIALNFLQNLPEE